MSKKNPQPQIPPQRPPVTVKPGDQIMLGSSWMNVTGVEGDQILWRNGERDGKLPLKMVTQSMVRPGDPAPEVADDDDCRAVRDTLGNLAASISKIVPDDDRDRAAVILRLRGKDEQTLMLPPALKVVAAGDGWRAVKHTTPEDVQAAQAANDEALAALAPRFNNDHVIATDDTDRKVGFFAHAGDGYGTIRYPNGGMIRRPVALIRLADQPLTSAPNPNDETDFLPGDPVYDVNDDQRIVGRFYADRLAGFGQILYPGNRTEQVALDVVRAALFTNADLGVIADELRDMTADEFKEALDAVADTLLDEDDDLIITEQDLAEDAAYTDADLERLTGVPLPPENDELLPPGEAQPIPPALISETGEIWRVGDSFRRRDGREYKVAAIDGDEVHLNHMINGVSLCSRVPMRDLPKLTADAGLIETDVREEMIDALKQRVRQLEDELARLHDEDRDTEPLAPETVKKAVRASQEMAQVEVFRWDDVKVESMTLEPDDITAPGARDARDAEIARLRNEGWFVVFETATPIVEATDTFAGQRVALYHTVRLERNTEDDDDPGQGEPERRDILDMAAAVVDSYTPDETPADAETETDLTPVPSAFRTPEHPITATIRMVGSDAVKDFYNTQVCEAFNLARGRAAVQAIPGEVSS